MLSQPKCKSASESQLRSLIGSLSEKQLFRKQLGWGCVVVWRNTKKANTNTILKMCLIIHQCWGPCVNTEVVVRRVRWSGEILQCTANPCFKGI